MSKSDSEFSRTVYSLPQQNGGSGGGGAPRLPVLVVLRGAQVGRRYLLNESGLVLGRRPDRADIVVPGDSQISSVHCRFERGTLPESWQVVDLASTNGTVIGGERVATQVLRDGDRLLVGETVLKFTWHDEVEEEFHRQVDHLMNIDDLTGLPVQRVFQQRFADALLACRRKNLPMAVYMMDMDGLKKMNDTHGHFVGANSIATVGRRLGALVADAGGVVSRFGGDEFSAFVPNVDRAAALAIGERMRAAVGDQPIVKDTITVNPTISIGCAVFPEDGQLAEELTRHADDALYRAKAAGRNRVSE
ncbi:MAG: GGDEF domain-containing protein [Planctomycetes bacterium]|nr:GGDEF domain-containing protein [Planctomycetota bacterium]